MMSCTGIERKIDYCRNQFLMCSKKGFIAKAICILIILQALNKLTITIKACPSVQLLHNDQLNE